MPLAEFNINYIGVLVSAIAGFIIGMAWYSKSLFGEMWMKLEGITKKDLKKQSDQKRKMNLVGGFASVLVMAFVLEYFLKATQSVSVAAGISTSVWIWFGFLATTMLGIVLWQNKPFKLYVINTMHYLVVLVVMSVILTMWQ